MTVTDTHSTSTQAPTSGRVAAVAAFLFATCLFLTVASVNVPHEASDAELLDWWRDSGNRLAGIISSLFAVASAVLMTVVVNHLSRRPEAEGSPAWLDFARSMGAAFTATLLVSAALRGVIGHMVGSMDEPMPPLEVLRYSTALNYYLIGLPVMAALALTILAVSVLTFRTGTLPRWTAYVGVVAFVVIAAAIAAQIGAYAIPAALLWAACLGVAFWRQS